MRWVPGAASELPLNKLESEKAPKFGGGACEKAPKGGGGAYSTDEYVAGAGGGALSAAVTMT